MSSLVTDLISPGIVAIIAEFIAAIKIFTDLRDALDRVAWWIFNYMITPVRNALQMQIFVLQIQTAAHFAYLTNLVYVLHLVEERYTQIEVAQERQARVADVNSARAYARALTSQLHQTIEQEAVAGYKAGSGIRTTVLQQLARDLNVRGLLDTVTTELLIKTVDALVTIDNPALAATANRIISAIIKKSGIGDDLGNWIDSLITPGAGGAAPKDLTGVIADLAHRIGELENWISTFMLDGGPELQDAAEQWKSISSLIVDAALLAFFGQAVADPVGWAAEVNDTVGVVANASIGSIISLIGHV